MASPGRATVRAVESARSTRPASLGIGVFVAADAITFAALIAAALVARAGGDWRAPGDPSASLAAGGVLTAALLAASAILLFGRGRRWASVGAALCGIGFVAGALLEWRALAAAGLAPGNSRFADAFFVITGYHMAHVAAGAVALAWLAVRPPRRPGPAIAIGWYWHFIDAIWLAIAATFYL